jgi:Secretion system C-terminal sorting domain
MRNLYYKTVFSLLALLFSLNIFSQTAQWRLVRDSYSSVDPDGAGAAIGSVVFGLEIRAVGADINDITQISVGYSYQSASALIPTTPGCAANVNSPANTTMGPAFTAVNFQYTGVSQCTNLTTSTGGQTFNRTASGTVDNASAQFNLTLAMGWTRVFTVTLWATGAVAGPEGGYVMVHSGLGGSPGELTSYNVTQSLFNDIVANSISFSAPVPLGSSGVLPVTFNSYDVKCNDKGALITWSTATEQNSDKFEIQRSENTIDWTTIDNVKAAGISNSIKGYQYLDLKGGAAYYRIRQVDLDGKYIYTTVKRTDCKAGQFDVVLYPVPAKDQLTVVIKSDKAVRTDLQMIDMSGKIVSRIPTQVNSGNNTINLNVSKLAAGQYMLVSSDGGVLVNKKFTIIR